MPERLSRAEHALRFGPTAGDRIRLGDTDLWIRIEEDLTEPADQAVWGYAKNWRSRMTQRDAAARDSELDAVIAGAIVVDPLLGIVKADIGIKDGRIVGVGRAGNPDITDGVDLTIGPNTWPIAAFGLIATPGVVDSHVHLLSPRLVPVALSAGVTTLITAGFEEPPERMRSTLEAFERLPVNVGLQASARTDAPGGLEPVLEAGAVGLKIHEDWGAYPEIIDATLRAADAHDVAVCLHTDGLNESVELEGTVEAIGGRAIHAYHVEGAGGGHIPDLIAIVREPNVFCSSTTPGIPYAAGAAEEHPDMILIVHDGNPDLPADVEAARERIHPGSMAAEGPLHELGAISIVNSDSQGMGRIGETFRRTLQLAHAMKAWRATDAGAGWGQVAAVRRIRPAPAPTDDRPDDNERVLRYLAKVSADPARVHGVADEVGSLAPGRLADVVLWRSTHISVKPAAVLKGGVVAWSAAGAGNASVHGAEPTRFGPDWGGLGDAPSRLATTFVSATAAEAGITEALGTRRRVVAVRGTRTIRREDLVANTAAPPIEVSPIDGVVTLGGRALACAPLDAVPLSRRYVLA
ncbi:MAG TPA: urease subunit alpha [Actinomycetota bacterium]|nr:urease subunit alpha [Actinomycetota bacterium]